MKRIFGILALLTVVALAATAPGYASEATFGNPPPVLIQTAEAEVPSVHEYSFSGWAIGLAPTYTNQQGCSNVGLQAVASTTLTPLWGWRLTASVNGFVPYHRDDAVRFDRYAAAMTGPVVNLGPLYAFAQVGCVVNPSSQYKAGLTANTGAGLAFDVGKRSRIFAEAAIDVAPIGKAPRSTLSAGIGYAVRL